MCCGFGDKSVSTIVRDVKPFMTVGGPGVCILHSAYELFIAGASCGPHAECTVHVSPRSVAASDRDERVEVIEGTGIHVPSLEQNECRSARRLLQGSLKRARL